MIGERFQIVQVKEGWFEIRQGGTVWGTVNHKGREFSSGDLTLPLSVLNIAFVLAMETAPPFYLEAEVMENWIKFSEPEYDA